MRSVPVADGIWWVGAVDWNLRDFHGFETPEGTSYNAYIVAGSRKTALIDTVKEQFVPELLSRVAEVVPLHSVDYIVVNHIEPDHHSGLRAVMEAIPGAEVVATATGVRGIAEFHGPDLPVRAVREGDSIDLGDRTLQFLPAPMVHWPDSMFTYVPESCTLLCNDAFGQHLAGVERFADEVGLDVAVEQLKVYYANILMPLAIPITKVISKVVEAGWACDTIAPSHGVIWRGSTAPAALDVYDRLTAGEAEDKLVVAYGTMWHSTDEMAREIADAAGAEGVDVRLFDLAVTPYAHVTRHLMDSRALVLGSPTLHHGMLYRPAGYLQYVSGLKPSGKLGASFGSFGWSGGAAKQMRARMEEIGFEMPFEDVEIKFRPLEADRRVLREWAGRIAREVLSRADSQSD